MSRVPRERHSRSESVDLEPGAPADDFVTLAKGAFLALLAEIDGAQSIQDFRAKVARLRNALLHLDQRQNGVFSPVSNDDRVVFRTDVLVSDCQQMLEAQTLERGKYYLRRLRKSVNTVRTGKHNDINLARWKEYDDIITDSLWVLDRRDTSGAHLGWYWGNFIPQIPHQMLRRYTKRGEWVLDTFSGSGTTLIECRRLGRNGLGLELSPTVVAESSKLIEKQPNTYGVATAVIEADSRSVAIRQILADQGIKQVQLVILHPPYHDIIRFSDDERDLSTTADGTDFLRMFGEVVANVVPYLAKERHLVLVIGDKYSKGEWIPLGFQCMQEVLKWPLRLKSIVVKNFDETRAKRSVKELWRYRALAGGFYVFKHEYVMLFEKL